MTRFIPALLVAVALAAGAGACGGDAGGGNGDRAAELRDAGLKFARCMRGNGIDMPDPKTDENGVTIAEPGDGQDIGVDGGGPSRRFRAAEEACRKHLAAVRPPQLSPEQQQEFRKQALAHARCMREHGVDFPDPTFTDDGGALVDIGPDSGIDPKSPTFERAQEQCRALMDRPMGGGRS